MKKSKLDDKAVINAFANKWLRKFKSPDFNEREFEINFGDECFDVGFDMDAGKSLVRKYPKAFENQGTSPFNGADDLKLLIDKINDVQILGNAIFSQYRYYTHWSMGESIDIEWFVIALTRLEKLTR